MFRTSSVHHQERFLQAVFADLVWGNTRTTRHIQPLQRPDVSSSTHSIYIYIYILQDDTRSIQYQVKMSPLQIKVFRGTISIFFTVGVIQAYKN